MNENSTAPVPNSANRNPYTLWFVVASFVLPVALAYIMYYFVEIKSFSNKGEILQPVVDIASLKLTNENGEIIAHETLADKWRFITFVGAECDDVCKKRLYEVGQVYKTLGKNRHRVSRVLVHLEPTSKTLDKYIEFEHSDMLHMNGDAKTINAAFGGKAKLDENELYIMDPLGNVMMRFTQDQQMIDIQHDMKKLLKASQIG